MSYCKKAFSNTWFQIINEILGILLAIIDHLHGCRQEYLQEESAVKFTLQSTKYGSRCVMSCHRFDNIRSSFLSIVLSIYFILY